MMKQKQHVRKTIGFPGIFGIFPYFSPISKASQISSGPGAAGSRSRPPARGMPGVQRDLHQQGAAGGMNTNLELKCVLEMRVS